MARLKTKWNQKERERTPEQIASAVGANIWLLAGDSCLYLENEGFETTTLSQRVDVISEFLAFCLHIIDRMTYGEIEEEERVRFINALGLHMAQLIDDSRFDTDGPGEYKKAFINLLNERMNEYSECSYDEEEGPGFNLKRIAANHVRDTMGEKDQKWIPDYVIDVEIPKMLKGLNRIMNGMGDSIERADFEMPPIPENGTWGDE